MLTKQAQQEIYNHFYNLGMQQAYNNLGFRKIANIPGFPSQDYLNETKALAFRDATPGFSAVPYLDDATPEEVASKYDMPAKQIREMAGYGKSEANRANRIARGLLSGRGDAGMRRALLGSK